MEDDMKLAQELADAVVEMSYEQWIAVSNYIDHLFKVEERLKQSSLHLSEKATNDLAAKIELSMNPRPAIINGTSAR